jgi:triphosphoribosyl-dephospho-CoA synthase
LTPATAIGEAFLAACRDEIEAPKPGNVHVFADGHGMRVAHFIDSAAAARAPLTAAQAPLGRRILGAVEATFAAVGMNTNLGILLLCAPLAAAAERDGGDLRTSLRQVLAGLDHHDCAMVFRAVALAAPGGLGTVPRHDVHAPAQVGLIEAMTEAAPRDRIARQYASGFHDIFVTGVGALQAARSRGMRGLWETVQVYLGFLAAFPDTHVQRKFGSAAADEVRDEAVIALAAWRSRSNPADGLDDLLAFDRHLKARGFNPGTSADLTVATLFADRLASVLITPRIDG